MADKKTFENVKNKIEENRLRFSREINEELNGDIAWHAVSEEATEEKDFFADGGEEVRFIGKNLEGGEFSGENLEGVNFSVANLTNVDFSNANLKGVDFSGANLTNANLSGADLTGAILSGSVLHKTNFTKAKLNGVKLVDADLEDAILLDIEIDTIGINELQALIEYLAKYYPHKLNFAKINLTLLNLASIDLSQVDLRGADFTGIDFTGVNITGLDLSQTNITPLQIAQALGRTPSSDELAKIMAPKKKKQGQNFKGIDFTDMFIGDKTNYAVWDFSKDKGVSIETLIKYGKKVFGKGDKPKVKDEKVLEEAQKEQDMVAKSHNAELRKVIEARKQKELMARRAIKDNMKKKDVRKFIPTAPRDGDRGR